MVAQTCISASETDGVLPEYDSATPILSGQSRAAPSVGLLRNRKSGLRGKVVVDAVTLLAQGYMAVDLMLGSFS